MTGHTRAGRSCGRRSTEGAGSEIPGTRSSADPDIGKGCWPAPLTGRRTSSSAWREPGVSATRAPCNQAGTRAPAASSALTVYARDAHRALPERRDKVQPQGRHIYSEAANTSLPRRFQTVVRAKDR